MRTIQSPKFLTNAVIDSAEVVMRDYDNKENDGQLYLVDIYGHLFVIFEGFARSWIVRADYKNLSEASDDFDAHVKMFGKVA